MWWHRHHRGCGLWPLPPGRHPGSSPVGSDYTIPLQGTACYPDPSTNKASSSIGTPLQNFFLLTHFCSLSTLPPSASGPAKSQAKEDAQHHGELWYIAHAGWPQPGQDGEPYHDRAVDTSSLGQGRSTKAPQSSVKECPTPLCKPERRCDNDCGRSLPIFGSHGL